MRQCHPPTPSAATFLTPTTVTMTDPNNGWKTQALQQFCVLTCALWASHSRPRRRNRGHLKMNGNAETMLQAKDLFLQAFYISHKKTHFSKSPYRDTCNNNQQYRSMVPRVECCCGVCLCISQRVWEPWRARCLERPWMGIYKKLWES
jgi:hypothetical protein